MRNQSAAYFLSVACSLQASVVRQDSAIYHLRPPTPIILPQPRENCIPAVAMSGIENGQPHPQPPLLCNIVYPKIANEGSLRRASTA